MCWHNLTFTKSIVSSGFATALTSPDVEQAYLDGTLRNCPYIPNPDFRDRMVSSFSSSATSEYAVEYDAEWIRASEYPRLPSRLSGVYAFGEYSECEKVADRYNWPLANIQQFELRPHKLNRVHRANMEIVSLMRSCYPRASWTLQSKAAIWRSYWKGHGSLEVEVPTISDGKPIRQTYKAGTIWEYVIEGHLELIHENDA